MIISEQLAPQIEHVTILNESEKADRKTHKVSLKTKRKNEPARE
jgi:hypothetical protein